MGSVDRYDMQISLLVCQIMYEVVYKIFYASARQMMNFNCLYQVRIGKTADVRFQASFIKQMFEKHRQPKANPKGGHPSSHKKVLFSLHDTTFLC